jgi:Ca2+-binding RTX toxin-like protein
MAIEGTPGPDTLVDTSGDDTINAGAGDDTITVTGGSDVVHADAGIDTLIIDWHDSLSGAWLLSGPIDSTFGGYDSTYSDSDGRGVDAFSIEKLIVMTGGGNDFVQPISHDDVISTGAGNDTIFSAAGAGPSRIDGGAGTDTVSADWSDLGTNQSVFFNINDPAGVTLADRYLVGVERLASFKTGAANDGITLGYGALATSDNNIDTGGGDDSVLLFSGTSYSDTGTNTIAFGTGVDQLDVAYNGLLSGGDGDVFMDAPTLDVNGYTGSIQVAGHTRVSFSGLDSLTITSGRGNDVIYGTGGDDLIFSTSGNDSVHAGGGNDRVDGGDGDDILDGGNDTDTLIYETAASGVTVNLGVTVAQDTIGAGVDTISGFENVMGSSKDDHLTGDGGDNVLQGENGDDVIDGGAGNDTASYWRSATGVTVHLDISGPQDTGGAGIDTLISIENIEGTGNADNLFDNTGNNRIDTGAGDDVVTVTGGIDSVIGWFGTDTLVVDWHDSIAAVGLASTFSVDGRYGGYDGNYTDSSGRRVDFTSIEKFIITTGSGDDSVITGGGDDIVSTGSGNDTIDSGGGNDTIAGGAGADHMAGGTGDDTYVVDNVGDVVTEDAGEGFDTVQTIIGSRSDYSQLYYLPDNVENLTGTSTTGQGVWGSSADNVINMGSGGDLIVLADRTSYTSTAGGHDSVNSGGGNDYIFFGGGLDALDKVDGGAGFDTVGLLGTYNLTLAAQSFTSIEKLALYSSGNAASPNGYTITTVDQNVAAGQQLLVVAASLQAGEHLVFNGSAEADGSFTIMGGHDTDTIIGGHGNDRFIGGGGADSLTGGAGNDVFQYNAVSDSIATATDTINDFSAGDKVDLWFIDADGSAANGDQRFSFIGTAGFSHNAGELRAVEDNANPGHWFIQGDTNGDGTADLVIDVTVTDGHAIGAGDFLL